MTAQRYRTQSIGHRRRRRQQLVLAVVVLVALIAAAGFYLGQRAALVGMNIDPESYRLMQLELPAVREELKALRGDLQVQRTRHEVDRRALEMVRTQMAVEKERTADLEEGLRFYKSLMSPGEVANGLSLRAPELVTTAGPRRYAYRIVVQQEARKHELLKGKLEVEVYGLLDGAQVSYPLVELSEDLEAGALALKFRYFQAIEGELMLPEVFEPEGMSVVASVSTPHKIEVREQFPWHIQEKFTHVGK